MSTPTGQAHCAACSLTVLKRSSYIRMSWLCPAAASAYAIHPILEVNLQDDYPVNKAISSDFKDLGRFGVPIWVGIG